MLQVEATKFTEVGFHGRDVDQIIRDLVDNAIIMMRQVSRRQCSGTSEPGKVSAQGCCRFPTSPPCYVPATSQRLRREMKAKIDEAVEERILSALLGDVSPETLASFRALYRWERREVSAGSGVGHVGKVDVHRTRWA